MMNQEDIFKKVGQILNELQDQYEFLAQNPKQLNELELELFLANANFLSDHVQIVKKINSNRPLKIIPEHTEDQSPVVALVPEKEPEPVIILSPEREPEPIQLPEAVLEPEMAKERTLEELEAEYAANESEGIEEEPSHEILPEQKEEVADVAAENEPLKFEFMFKETPATDKFEFEEKSVDAIFDRPLSKEEEDIIAQKQQLRDNQAQQHLKEEITAEPVPLIVQESQPEPVAPPKEEKIEERIVAPVYVTEKLSFVEPVKTPEPNQAKPTLNDLLAGRNNLSGSVNNENNKPAITDLKQAINLNQKLLYIKDLFNGYNLAYAEAIELLNKMPDFKTADTFLKNNYAIKNNWTAKQNTVDQFYELLNQRFPVK